MIKSDERYNFNDINTNLHLYGKKCCLLLMLCYAALVVKIFNLVNVNLIGIATFSLSQNPLLSTKIRTVPATKIRVHSTLLTCHLIIEEYMFYVIPYIYTQMSLAGETRRADFCNFLRFRQLPGNYFPVVGGARRLQSLGMTQIFRSCHVRHVLHRKEEHNEIV
ncbi:hypothetical protein GQX74_012167 [Glossina fuscipes]|nr:hypothetical protein GQX74_012167 [Glossina fuscipes]